MQCQTERAKPNMQEQQPAMSMSFPEVGLLSLDLLFRCGSSPVTIALAASELKDLSSRALTTGSPLPRVPPTRGDCSGLDCQVLTFLSPPIGLRTTASAQLCTSSQNTDHIQASTKPTPKNKENEHDSALLPCQHFCRHPCRGPCPSCS